MGYTMNGETLSVNYCKTISTDTTQYARQKALDKLAKVTGQKPKHTNNVNHTGYLVPVGKPQPRKKIAQVGRAKVHSNKHAEVGRVSCPPMDLRSGLQYIKGLFNPQKK